MGYVTREDCARAAAAALAATDSGRVTLSVTGPAIVTHTELAQIASEVTGRPVTYTPVTADALKTGMVAAGLPEILASVLVSFDTATAEGRLAVVSTSVADLTGQPPQSVGDYLLAYRAALLPDEEKTVP